MLGELSIGRKFGLGAYPDNPCFDPNRPIWLPYPFNDTTEMACLQNAAYGGTTAGVSNWFNLDALKQLIAPSVIPTPVVKPATAGVPVDYTPTIGSPAQVGSDNTQGQTTIHPMSVDIPDESPSPSCDSSSASWSDPSTWCLQQWGIVIGGIVAVSMLLPRVFGR